MFFGDLTDAERKQVEGIGKLREFRNDDCLVAEGDTDSFLYLIKSGKVQVRKKLEQEKFICLIELGPGDIFGEISFLAAVPRSASVVALDPGTALLIDRDSFLRFVKDQPAIGAKVYRAMAQDLAGRLNRNTEELRRAMLWAMDEMRGFDRCLRP
jgi:CRP-like cAMP-binding protein